MRLTDLVWRNMLQNMKQYYLYFFSLIFSIMLYFIFSTLQYDDVISMAIRESGFMSAAFRTGVIFLAVIMLVFVLYAKALFYKRRGREIGLYQLIGLSKGQVSRMLIIENFLLLAGAAAAGTVLGLIFARLFLLLFVKVLQVDAEVTLQFSADALLQTGVLFLLILVLTTLQIILIIRKHTLTELFRSKEEGEGIRKVRPVTQAVMAILGLSLTGFGYWFSGNMLNQFLFINMLVVLFTVILGTFLLFSVTISWVLERIRTNANGHLSFKNALSIAPVIHRMKSNAKLLTLITTLSAVTLTLVTVAYSLYYSSAEEARQMYPHDFLFTEDGWEEAAEFVGMLHNEGVEYSAVSIDTVITDVSLSNFNQGFGFEVEEWHLRIAPENQLQAAGIDVEVAEGEGVFFGTFGPDMDVSMATAVVGDIEIDLLEGRNRYALNIDTNNGLIAVDEETFQYIDLGKETFAAVNVADDGERERANEIYHSIYPLEDGTTGLVTFVEQMRSAREMAGMFIFIAGFLGVVFLAATGSILYFKQMTEVEEEKGSYRTLRQLGFTVEEVLGGISRKQLLFFTLPLAIGILHSYFAVQSVSFLFRTSIVVPVAICLIVYTLIYAFFYLLSLVNTRQEIKSVLSK
ncbi:FtsX-like permease family protein [Evansella sp. LMS18]|uniref:FtsX-like permease family protein n=1 Tax=Evansella sp. LMS18 TaxID=2924033 RepID=UPI0020D0336E|nr:FtsX-like permease family protein [Evansella sp. LMS18]UTR12814.1 FtsX-like permease family protein [Evansella sp. LMS18]